MKSSNFFWMQLQVIFSQATEDPSTLTMDGKGYLAQLTKGVKIVRDNETGIVAIYNTFTKGHFPTEITEDQYLVFTNHGWVEGVKNIQAYNLNKVIASLKESIRQERATTKNAKRIKSLINKLKKMQDEFKTITE